MHKGRTDVSISFEKWRRGGDELDEPEAEIVERLQKEIKYMNINL